jgi:hypothetical protein
MNPDSSSAQNNLGIYLFPNPASTKLTIAAIGSTNQLNVCFFNAQGELVKQTIISSETAEINLADMSNGIYLAQVKNDAGEILKVEKIIKAE